MEYVVVRSNQFLAGETVLSSIYRRPFGHACHLRICQVRVRWSHMPLWQERHATVKD